ncbi:hypothetical protein FH972_026532 [Carpinus fangiana]|uniref:Uncharacterized protein n=1 Tax=Carpinus fangiana TaxID=176857 RepID=A0A5N6L4Q7_9ROSI|nr:hypothetical protein FH972_026532 [Carpinus fangiana]
MAFWHIDGPSHDGFIERRFCECAPWGDGHNGEGRGNGTAVDDGKIQGPDRGRHVVEFTPGAAGVAQGTFCGCWLFGGIESKRRGWGAAGVGGLGALGQSKRRSTASMASYPSDVACWGHPRRAGDPYQMRATQSNGGSDADRGQTSDVRESRFAVKQVRAGKGVNGGAGCRGRVGMGGEIAQEGGHWPAEEKPKQQAPGLATARRWHGRP